MSGYISSENKLITCPYDESHKVKSSRFQLHIANCKLNNLDKNKKTCPFNATHLLPQGEYDHHLITCPDRGSLDRQLAQVDKNNPFKGRTDVPQYSDPIQSEENWELEPQTVALPAPPPGAIIEPPAMAKPAERRRLYKELHQMPAAADSKKTSSPSPKVSAPPRQPKQPSETQRIHNQQSNLQAAGNLGLGRAGQTSRIAANFPRIESSQSPSYSSIVGDMSNLGLGRGSHRVNQDSPSIFNVDDDFPALGLGRGRVHVQAVKIPGVGSQK